jgi:polyisoprenyl-teichoic acid--peptidoglycan teichoic acid transferase
VHIPKADLRRKSELVRFRRALALLGMTLVLPGSAQVMCGSKTVGRAALRVLALCAGVCVIGFLLIGRNGVIKLGLNTTALTMGEVAVTVLALCWLALFVDAWRLGRPPTLRRPHRLVSAGLSLTLMAGITAPMGYGAYLMHLQRNVIKDVFVQGGLGQLYNGRLNVLLLGGDGGLDRTGIRTDSISLASIDVATGKTVLFSLPRNMQYVQFPPGTTMAKHFPNGFPDFAFGIYTWATENRNLFPGVADPGALAVEQAVAQTLGIPVHYYALVNLAGFQSVIDALGGITLRVNERLPIGGGHTMGGAPNPILGWIEPGLQHLDGYHALWYARSRATTTDYDRMARQRCVFGAILRQANPATVLKNYSGLAHSAKKVLTTDLTTGALSRLVDVANLTKNTQVTSVQFTNQVIDPANPDINYIRQKVQEAIAASEAQPVPTAKPTASAKPKPKPAKAKPKPKPTKKPTVSAAPGDPQSVDDSCQYS